LDPCHLKFDIRCYAQAVKVQWIAAWVYQGQTINFRSLRGVFAPVYRLADAQLALEVGTLSDKPGSALALCMNERAEKQEQV
jgi:hypothetical protein